MNVDLAIVGGGPAGLATALYAARAGLSPVVFEPGAVPIDKACGEGLMPGTVRHLDALGVRPAGRPFVGVRYRDADQRTISAEADFSGPVGLGVRRTTLHAAMSAAVEDAGIPVIRERVRDFSVTEDRVTAASVSARYLIGADGLHSSVRRAMGLQPTEGRPPRRFGIRRHYHIAPWTNRVEVHWSAVGEAYVTPLAPDLVGVALLYEPPGRFDDLLARFPILRESLGDARPASRDRGAGPFDFRAVSPVKGRALLVGDAAGYLDPITGEGIQLSLVTAQAAVAAIVDGTPERYAADWARAVRRCWWLTRGLLTITRSRSLHRPLIRLLDRFDALFDGALALVAG